jgi:hypothetical protein
MLAGPQTARSGPHNTQTLSAINPRHCIVTGVHTCPYWQGAVYV